MSSTTIDLNHPLIGTIRGKRTEDVAQYLGIKYASLQNFFSEPEAIVYDQQHQPLDATGHGPPVIIPPGCPEMEMAFIQQTLPSFDDVPGVSGVDGLNLNITIPLPHDASAALPVLVFIHGGGFNFGASSYPQYDQKRIVQASGRLGKPMVAVNLNYRVGIPGFLTSEELCNAGYRPNRGIRDQQAALLWIKDNISGFGGDPNKMTVIGQSAGAGKTIREIILKTGFDLCIASINFHLQSKKPLFSQAVLLGGSSVLVRPQTPEEAESIYQQTLRAMGIDGTVQQRITSLVKSSATELLSAASRSRISPLPIVDHDLITFSTSFADLSTGRALGSSWCSRVFCLNSQFDGSLFLILDLAHRVNGITKSFSTWLKQAIGNSTASRILQEYGIYNDTTDEESLLKIGQLLTDVGYYAPATAMAQASSCSFIVGHFNEGNPWDGPHRGLATHILDLAYLWGNYDEKMDDKNRKVAEALSTDIISFVWGEDSLPAFNDHFPRKVVVYGPSGENMTKEILNWDDEKARRKTNVFDLGKQAGGLDKLLEALLNFCWQKMAPE